VRIAVYDIVTNGELEGAQTTLQSAFAEHCGWFFFTQPIEFEACLELLTVLLLYNLSFPSTCGVHIKTILAQGWNDQSDAQLVLLPELLKASHTKKKKK